MGCRGDGEKEEKQCGKCKEKDMLIDVSLNAQQPAKLRERDVQAGEDTMDLRRTSSTADRGKRRIDGGECKEKMY